MNKRSSQGTTAAALATDAEPKGAGPSLPYTDLARLSNADGLIAIISQRRSTGVITFAIMKEFERYGAKETTSFVPENLHQSYLDLLVLVGERIAKIRKEGVQSTGKTTGRTDRP